MAQFVPPPDGPLPDYRFALEQQPAREEVGGTAREASATEFPASLGVAGVSMRLVPGGMRELHWHANAAEWGYVAAGLNSGTYEEIGLSSWFAANPRKVVATNLGLDDEAAALLPTDETFISPPRD